MWKTLHKFVQIRREIEQKGEAVLFVVLPSFLFLLEFKTCLHFYRKSSHRGRGRQFSAEWLWEDPTIDILEFLTERKGALSSPDLKKELAKDENRLRGISILRQEMKDLMAFQFSLISRRQVYHL